MGKLPVRVCVRGLLYNLQGSPQKLTWQSKLYDYAISETSLSLSKALILQSEQEVPCRSKLMSVKVSQLAQLIEVDSIWCIRYAISDCTMDTLKYISYWCVHWSTFNFDVLSSSRIPVVVFDTNNQVGRQFWQKAGTWSKQLVSSVHANMEELIIPTD